MDAAVERVFSWLCEAEFEFVIRVERTRSELALGAVDGMRNVVMVDPGHLRARFHDDRARSKGEIVDLDLNSRFRRCSWRSGHLRDTTRWQT